MFFIDDYRSFFKNILNFKKERFFFFTFEEPFLLSRAILSLMSIMEIEKKRVFIGREFNINEIRKEEKNISIFKKEKFLNVIYDAEDIKFNKNFFDVETESPFVFVFSDRKNFEKNRVLSEVEKGIYVHFPRVDIETAFKWFKKEIKLRGKNVSDLLLMSIVKERVGELTKLNNLVNLVELGANVEEFLKKEEKELRNYDSQAVINIVISLIRKGVIPHEYIWKVYEPLLYNRRVNYDFELEMKQILRRIYEKRNKY
ncbi:MAG: hypothetical protein ABIM58_00385 [candidate division WOR-3 bacterium]